MKTRCQFLPRHEAEAEEGGAEVVEEGVEVSLQRQRAVTVSVRTFISTVCDARAHVN